jgi:hypothetical protein
MKLGNLWMEKESTCKEDYLDAVLDGHTGEGVELGHLVLYVVQSISSSATTPSIWRRHFLLSSYSSSSSSSSSSTTTTTDTPATIYETDPTSRSIDKNWGPHLQEIGEFGLWHFILIFFLFWKKEGRKETGNGRNLVTGQLDSSGLAVVKSILAQF